MNTNPDAIGHVRGESLFVDDLPEPAGTLHAAVCVSPMPHGRNLRISSAAARGMAGVRAILTAADIPGRNQIGAILEDEPLLAEGEVHCIGQPVALVVAETAAAARRAARAVEITADPLPAIWDPREAYAQGNWLVPPRTFSCGEVESAWAQCATIVTGTAATGAQEHVYLETQGALAMPSETGVRIWSATQAPTAVQRMTAQVLGIPMHRVEVDTPRLGGAFG
ncbi:MAG: molybdopterin-dependent oxidoreductase, partial [Kiritimatiellae bacterium]|nr:molybdopterin-dependent oxidoreductase [Kiritimatiellia bacterium]